MELRGHEPLTLAGNVSLPLGLYSSGQGPDRVFDSGEEAERIDLHKIVLTNGLRPTCATKSTGESWCGCGCRNMCVEPGSHGCAGHLRFMSLDPLHEPSRSGSGTLPKDCHSNGPSARRKPVRTGRSHELGH